MTGFTLREMMLHGWPVISVLMIMSIYSMAVIVDRYLTLKRAHVDTGAFLKNLFTLMDGPESSKALDYCVKTAKPVATVVAAILRQPGKREAKERALLQTLQAQIADLEVRVPGLGTIASTAPFVGLLGTVIGIIKAFRDIAANVGGGPEVVSAGIAEALITTAFGLLVAIPAVFGFNYCVNRIRRMSGEIDLAARQVIDRTVGDE